MTQNTIKVSNLVQMIKDSSLLAAKARKMDKIEERKLYLDLKDFLIKQMLDQATLSQIKWDNVEYYHVEEGEEQYDCSFNFLYAGGQGPVIFPDPLHLKYAVRWEQARCMNYYTARLENVPCNTGEGEPTFSKKELLEMIQQLRRGAVIDFAA